MGILSIFGLFVTGAIITKVILDRVRAIMRMKEFVELENCPFKFKPKGTDTIIFQLTKESTLWCEYALGIRSDGYYGISLLQVLGINGSDSGIHNLKVGQSVFPIIMAFDEFMTWAKTKTFKIEVKDSFDREWAHMRKNLDNLRYLETEEQKKSKKPK